MSYGRYAPLALVVVVAVLCSVAGAEVSRSYVVGNYFLNLDGVNCGPVKSVEGGAVSAEVIQEPVGPDRIVRKHVGKPKYEELVLQVGFGNGKNIYDWIQQSWTGNYQRKNGSILATDYNMTPKSQREFFNALITETTIPALDGASKELAYLTVKIAPESLRSSPSGSKPAGGFSKEEQKVFLPCNFRLEIDGLDCTRVNRIDALTVKQTAVMDDVGEARDSQRQPGRLEFSHLRLTVAESHARSFLDWHEDFVIKGNNDVSKEKNGVLTLLSPNREKALARVRFHNLGIFEVKPETGSEGTAAIARLAVGMYVERMEFLYEPGTAADTSTPAPAPAPDPALAPAPVPAPLRPVLRRPE